MGIALDLEKIKGILPRSSLTSLIFVPCRVRRSSGSGTLPAVTSRKLLSPARFLLTQTSSLLSKPTRGLDVGAIEFVHKALIRERDREQQFADFELDEVMTPV